MKIGLAGRLGDALADLLPQGSIRGREYVCGSLAGGFGKSCSTNLDTGIGADFNTGESWSDIIALAALVRGVSNHEAAVWLAERYGLQTGKLKNNQMRSPNQQEFTPISWLSTPQFTPTLNSQLKPKREKHICGRPYWGARQDNESAFTIKIAGALVKHPGICCLSMSSGVAHLYKLHIAEITLNTAQ